MPKPPVMLEGLAEHVRPIDGETVVAILTVSVKPFSGITVTSDVTDAPRVVLTIVGLANN